MTSYIAPGGPYSDPERLLVAPLLERPGEEPRYLLLRWPDWPPPALLSVESRSSIDSPASAVVEAVAARMGVSCTEPPRFSDLRMPVRMRQPQRGREEVGWLRAVAVRVEGNPAADALIEAVVALPLDQALASLTTDVERTVLEAAARLLDERRT